MENIINQLYQLLASLLCGFLLAFLYEIYRFLTVFCRVGKKLLWLTDFLWWLLAFALCFLLWLNYVPGEIRLLFFVGQGLGFGLGRFYFARFLRKTLNALDRNLKKRRVKKPVDFTFLEKAGKYVAWPFILLARFSDFGVRFFLQICRTIRNIYRWLRRIGRKLAKPKKKRD